MKVRHQASTPAAVLGFLVLSGCSSSELTVPTNHPGHPQARAGRLQQSAALGAAYDVAAAESPDQSRKPTSAPDDHAVHHHGNTTGGERHEPTTDAIYTCPMHPEVVRKEPGSCPICGMHLVPKKDGK